jgi:hypothetical protein
MTQRPSAAFPLPFGRGRRQSAGDRHIKSHVATIAPIMFAKADADSEKRPAFGSAYAQHVCGQQGPLLAKAAKMLTDAGALAHIRRRGPSVQAKWIPVRVKTRKAALENMRKKINQSLFMFSRDMKRLWTAAACCKRPSDGIGFRRDAAILEKFPDLHDFRLRHAMGVAVEDRLLPLERDLDLVARPVVDFGAEMVEHMGHIVEVDIRAERMGEKGMQDFAMVMVHVCLGTG